MIDEILSKYEIIVDESERIYVTGISPRPFTPLRVSSLDDAFETIRNQYIKDTQS